MRDHSKSLFLALFVFFAITAAGVYAQPKTSPTPTAKMATANLKFPEIDGWVKGESVGMPYDQMGMVVPYNSKNGASVTIYVYNRGLKDIPATLTASVKDEFDGARKSLFELEKMGLSSNVKEIKSETSKLGGDSGTVSSLYALFSMSIRGENVKSEIYLFPYDHNFVKIRITQKGIGSDALATDLNAFFKSIDSLFAK
jgi:hypothetical protein